MYRRLKNNEVFTFWLENAASKRVTWIISKKTKNLYNEDVIYNACKPQKKKKLEYNRGKDKWNCQLR